MFRKGIYNINDLILKDPSFFSNKNIPISINLLLDIEKLSIDKKEKYKEIIMETFAFSTGAYRKTHKNRFPDFDQEAVKLISTILPKNKLCKIHDVAVSDGRTSIDFFLQLKKIYNNLEFTATDRDNSALAYKGKANRIIVKDADGKKLQTIIPPFVINFHTPKMAKLYKLKLAVKYPIELLLKTVLKINFFEKILIDPERDGKRIYFWDKKVLDFSKENKNFMIRQYDILQKPFAKFNVIRAMNVINKTYFSPKEASAIYKNFLDSLNEQGLLITGSNKNAGSNINGDVFQKQNDGTFISLKKFNAGSPYREIALNEKYL